MARKCPFIIFAFLSFWILSFFDLMVFGCWQEGLLGALKCYSVPAAWQGLICASFWCGFALVLGRRSKLPLFCVFWVILAFELAQIVAVRRFHTFVGGEWLILLMTSSSKEMLEFLSVLGSPTLLFMGLCCSFAAIWLCRFAWRQVSCFSVADWSMRGALIGCLLIFPLFTFNRTTDFTHASPHCRYVWFVIDTVMKYRFYREMDDCLTPRVPDGIVCDKKAKNSGMLGVIVIGESASRNHWSLYGYPRQTTPEMDKIKNELVVFSDMRAASIYTVDAVRYLLTASDINSAPVVYTFSSACKQAGYLIVSATAQGHWGRMRNWEQLVMGPADVSFSVNDLGIKGPCYDTDLLPPLFRAIGASESNLTIAVVHLMGSHMKFQNQCPEDQRTWTPDFIDECNRNFDVRIRENINHYDNTIHFTDAFLGNLVQHLKHSGKPSFMVYISDHGETPATGIVRCYTDKNIWQVPMIIWLSDGYRRMHPEIVEMLEKAKDRPYQSDQLLEGLMCLSGLTWPDRSKSNCFFDPSFLCRKVRPIRKGQAFYLPDGEK